MADVKKDGRLEIIKMLVSGMELSTQEELLQQLAIFGCPTSQTTLVRDLRQLHIIKGHNKNGNYVYLMPGDQRYRTVSDTHVTVDGMNRLGVVNVKFSGNMGVIHTPPGHAAHVAYDIDNAHIDEILGTVAGDDTVFFVMAEGAERSVVLDKISTIKI